MAKNSRKTGKTPERTARRPFAERQNESENSPRERSDPAEPGPVGIEGEPVEVNLQKEEPQLSDADQPIEKPSALVEKFYDFMVVLRRAGYSVGGIASLLKVSKSTVHAHVSHVQPEVDESDGVQPPASSVSSPPSSSPPPRILELDRTQDEVRGQMQREMEANGTLETQILNDNDPRWRIAKALLVADALRVRVYDPMEYVSDWVLPDVALARDWAAWVPGDSREHKTANFQKLLLYARRYLQMGRVFQEDGIVRTEGETNVDA